jgi:hypothetical protein
VIAAGADHKVSGIRTGTVETGKAVQEVSVLIAAEDTRVDGAQVQTGILTGAQTCTVLKVDGVPDLAWANTDNHLPTGVQVVPDIWVPAMEVPVVLVGMDLQAMAEWDLMDHPTMVDSVQSTDPAD